MQLVDLVNKSLSDLNFSRKSFFSSDTSIYQIEDAEQSAKKHFFQMIHNVADMSDDEGYLSVTITNDNITLYYRISNALVTSTSISQGKPDSKSILRIRVLILQMCALALYSKDYKTLYSIINDSNNYSTESLLDYVLECEQLFDKNNKNFLDRPNSNK